MVFNNNNSKEFYIYFLVYLLYLSSLLDSKFLEIRGNFLLIHDCALHT